MVTVPRPRAPTDPESIVPGIITVRDAGIDAWRDVPWQVLRTPAWPGADNMALDLALLDDAVAASAPRWTLRLYAWARPTLSFGRNEQASRHFTPEGLTDAGVDAVRRPTGGRALLHWREVTYSLTGALPMDAPWRPVYDDINAVLVDALRALGVPAELAVQPAGDARGRACFDRPSPGEVTVHGQKLVGSAVWRRAHGFLQHGSILIDDDQSRIPTLAHGTMPPVPAPATLSALLGEAPDTSRVEQAIIDALASRRGAPQATLDGEALRTRASFLTHLDTERDPAWTWRS
jgi:lipoate-protein ligase A